MKGKITELTDEPLSERSEAAIMELLERKTRAAASLAVRLLEAAEEIFGPGSRRKLIEHILAHSVYPRREKTSSPTEDLRAFCTTMERGCTGSHRWERTVDEPHKIGYRFTYCLWAEIFRKLKAEDLGMVLCEADEPAAKAFNPAIRFRRTKLLMKGDECCDHLFFVER